MSINEYYLLLSLTILHPCGAIVPATDVISPSFSWRQRSRLFIGPSMPKVDKGISTGLDTSSRLKTPMI